MSTTDDTLEQLTAKQAEALSLASMHLTSKEIALRLHLSPSAVDQRLDSARRTLGASTRGEAVRIFQRSCAQEVACSQFATDSAQVSPSDDPRHRALDGLDETIFRLADAVAYAPQAPWHSWLEQVVPELTPGKIGTGRRLGLIVWGAVGMLVLIGLLAAVVIGLNALI
jgi:DNA-binding CsgD family transcriptional regulator